MAKALRKVDKVRASRDGHEYHEAWTARKAMQLLLGDDRLIGIAVEGLDPDEQTRATPETVEVADLTLYYGQGTVRVRISSVLVAPRKAACVAKALISEEPMHVWLPEYDEDDGGGYFLRNEKPDCVPWVVSPSGEGRLDADDPLGSVLAMRRPRVASRFASQLGLMPGDPFCRVWLNRQRRVVACAEAWGREKTNSEDPTVSGTRLLCSRGLLKRILTGNNSDLLMLLVLQRYEKGTLHHSKTTFNHTVAVIRVTKSLEVRYYRGRINHLFESKF